MRNKVRQMKKNYKNNSEYYGLMQHRNLFSCMWERRAGARG